MSPCACVGRRQGRDDRGSLAGDSPPLELPGGGRNRPPLLFPLFPGDAGKANCPPPGENPFPRADPKVLPGSLRMPCGRTDVSSLNWKSSSPGDASPGVVIAIIFPGCLLLSSFPGGKPACRRAEIIGSSKYSRYYKTGNGWFRRERKSLRSTNTACTITGIESRYDFSNI